MDDPNAIYELGMVIAEQRLVIRQLVQDKVQLQAQLNKQKQEPPVNDDIGPDGL